MDKSRDGRRELQRMLGEVAEAWRLHAVSVRDHAAARTYLALEVVRVLAEEGSAPGLLFGIRTKDGG